jgi:predicted PolB exonuclease-like 3'-5' exonuclease
MICKHDSLARSCHICYLEAEIESLEAITELALKGLEFYGNKKLWEFDETGSRIPMLEYEYELAVATLAKIERLSK